MTQFLIDPQLPEGFQVTPYDERSHAEIKAWWNVPYITTETADDVEAHTRKNEERLKVQAPELVSPDVEALVEKNRASFLANWPSGTSYTVHCLDGGAWDRPTWCGDFGALEEAQECCEQRSASKRKEATDWISGRLAYVAKHWKQHAVVILNDMHAECVRDSDPEYLPKPVPIELENIPDDVAQLIRAQLDGKGNLPPLWNEAIDCAFEALMPD